MNGITLNCIGACTEAVKRYINDQAGTSHTGVYITVQNEIG